METQGWVFWTGFALAVSVTVTACTVLYFAIRGSGPGSLMWHE